MFFYLNLQVNVNVPLVIYEYLRQLNIHLKLNLQLATKRVDNINNTQLILDGQPNVLSEINQR